MAHPNAPPVNTDAFVATANFGPDLIRERTV
jgi:hypothetical protein